LQPTNHCDQEAADAKVDLPEDDPAIVTLLIQYIYEAEYEPMLVDSRKAFVTLVPAETTPVVRVNKQRGYHYTFPHSCDGPCDNARVCHHHNCNSTCGHDCSNFVCTLCCTWWGKPAIVKGAEHAAELLLHAKMYEIGDKYDVEGLKELAQEKFSWACSVYWDSEYFAPAAHYAFSTTPDEDTGLRDVVGETLFDHINLVDKPEVEAVLNEFNGLAVGLLKRTKRSKKLSA
jgi:hypothetical protein